MNASTPNAVAATVAPAMPVATLLPTAVPSPPTALSPEVMDELIPPAAWCPAAVASLAMVAFSSRVSATTGTVSDP